MKRTCFVLLFCLLAVAGCSEGESYRVFVEFPDDQALGQTATLWVAASEIPPGGDCIQLTSGNARPGENGYEIEDHVFIHLDEVAGSSDLNNIGPGPRLFFAEALDSQDVALLNGCTWSETGPSADDLITIVLDWIAECEVDADCPDDGLWCNGEDICRDGVCINQPRDCSHLESPCNSATCNEDQDVCVLVTDPDGSDCDDGLYCTQGESCLSGECQGGEPRDCSAESGACLADPVCDESSDACVGEPLPQGTVCDDGLYCTLGGACDGAGNCVGEQRDCSALDNQCNQGVCDEEANACAAEPAHEDDSCNDGLYCTGGDRCNAGACTGSAIDCSDDDDCTRDSCDEIGDTCQHTWTPNPGAEGQTVPGTCGDGLDNDCDHLADFEDPECQPCQQDADCDDGDICTINTCNAQSQCQAASNDGVACDDGVNCTTGDECADRICVGQPLDCSHLDEQCSQGFCNEVVGECHIQPINQGQACADDLYCTVDTTCNLGSCAGGTQRDCSEFTDACNIGTCNEMSDHCQAGPRPDGTACDDGAYCNGAERFSGGTCLSEGDPCQGGPECDNICDEVANNCQSPVGTPCGDSTETICDQADDCDGAGSCRPNYVYDGASCDDGLFCNGTDLCSGNGHCEHYHPPCEASEMCLEDTDQCVPAAVAGVFVSLGSGSHHVCGITPQGKLYCWGLDSEGQLGNGGSNTNASEPLEVDYGMVAGSGAFVQVEGGNEHTCGLTGDGQVYCWGDDTWGQLGNGTTGGNMTVPYPVDLTEVGNDEYFIQLASGLEHACALSGDGVVYCWGDNSHGQVGMGSEDGMQDKPREVNTGWMTGETSFVHIAANGNHSCGITGQGVAHCWGDNSAGQLGDGTTTQKLSPWPVDVSGLPASHLFISLHLGQSHTCGITSGHLAWCWGTDFQGAMGAGPGQDHSPLPVLVATGSMTGSEMMIDIACGDYFCLAVAADGRPYGWGYNDTSQLGNGDSESQEVPDPVDTWGMPGSKSFVQMAAGDNHACGLTAEGRAYCWGWDDHGQCGDGSDNSIKPSPVAVTTAGVSASPGFTKICNGDFHACGLTAAGEVYCWGYDEYGMIGDGDDDNFIEVSPHPVDTSNITGDPAFARLFCGGWHNCAVTGEGKTYCWGWDDNGQVGDGGSSVNAFLPTAIASSQIFLHIQGGFVHTCGVTADGMVHCWGSDAQEQLGNGDGIAGLQAPVQVQGFPASERFSRVCTGGYHSCALSTTGQVYCWGRNTNGQLGNATIGDPQAQPQALDTTNIAFDKSIRTLACGSSHTCAVSTLGLGYCWGLGDDGEVGNGMTGSWPEPQELDLTHITGSGSITWIGIDGGSSHTCGWTSNRKAYCWGMDNEGALGNGEGTDESIVPFPVDSTGGFVSVSGGLDSNCGITTAALPVCWGSDDYGQVGDGSDTIMTGYQSPVPVDTSGM